MFHKYKNFFINRFDNKVQVENQGPDLGLRQMIG